MKNKIGKWFKITLPILVVLSLGISVAEGILYYRDTGNAVIRFLLILRNCIRMFVFEPEIGIKDVAAVLKSENVTALETVIGYLYSFSCFIAPYCTVSYVYRLVARIFRLKSLKEKNSKDPRIVIFGFNPFVKQLIENKRKTENYRIHIVCKKGLGKDDEADLLVKGVILHKADLRSLDRERQARILKEAEIGKADCLLLLDESAAENYAVYLMLREIARGNADPGESLREAASPKPDAKIYCLCETAGSRSLFAETVDKETKEIKKAKKAEETKETEKHSFGDIEFFDLPALRIRNTVRKHPFETYYEESGIPMEKWDLHLLLIGMNSLSSKYILQAMNLGVVTESNRILVDVIDGNAAEQRENFLSAFNPDYVSIGEDSAEILPEKADGSLKIRFSDVSLHSCRFGKKLEELSEEIPYTYVAICAEDPDGALLSLSAVKKYFAGKNVSLGRVPCAVRIDDNEILEQNLASDGADIFPIDTEKTLSLSELMRRKLNQDAKQYNYIYSKLMESSTRGTPGTLWSEKLLYQRESSVALAEHNGVNGKLLSQFPVDEGRVRAAVDPSSGKEFDEAAEELLRNDPTIYRLARIEHRRWCYFMASIGWGRTRDFGPKNEDALLSPYMCTWDDLEKYNPAVCKYDIMPVLMLTASADDASYR